MAKQRHANFSFQQTDNKKKQQQKNRNDKAGSIVEHWRRLLEPNGSRMQRDVVVSSLMCHHRGVEERVGGVGGVVALRVRGSKETRRLGWRFVVKSVKSDSLVRSVASPSVHIFLKFLFPSWIPLSPLQGRYKLTNNRPQVSSHRSHTSSSSHTRTNKQTVEIRPYKKYI